MTFNLWISKQKWKSEVRCHNTLLPLTSSSSFLLALIKEGHVDRQDIKTLRIFISTIWNVEEKIGTVNFFMLWLRIRWNCFICAVHTRFTMESPCEIKKKLFNFVQKCRNVINKTKKTATLLMKLLLFLVHTKSNLHMVG